MSDRSLLASQSMSDAFVVAGGEDTLRTALAELETRGGQEWWFLVVMVTGSGELLAAPFSAFTEPLEEDPDLLDRPLCDLGYPLSDVRWLAPDTDLPLAYAAAADNRHGLVVIAEGALEAEHDFRVLGVIHAGTRQAMVAPGGRSLFDLLAGPTLPGSPPVPKMEPARRGPEPVGAEPEEMRSSREEVRSKSGELEGSILKESMLEEASPPASMESASADEVEEAAESINVSIGGNVSAGGTITVAGRDVIYNVLPPEKQTKEQARRFEAAFPREVHRGETYDLWVVVALPDAPPFFTDEQEANIVEEKPDSPVSVAFEVDRATGTLKPAEVEVQVTGDGFEILGDTSRLLTVHPDGTPDKRRFLAKALETGTQRLIVEFMQDGKLLKEMTIAAEVFAPDKKPAGALNLRLQVAIFGITMSFAAGGAA